MTTVTAPNTTTSGPTGRGLPRLALWLGAAGVVVVLAILAGLAFWGSGNNTAKASPGGASSGPDWFVAEKRSFDLTVTASGDLQAKNQVDIKSQVDGYTTITEVIEEGVQVKGPVRDENDEIVEEGTVLARLADDKIKDKIEQAELDLQSVRAAKISAEQMLAIEESEAISARKAAELKVTLAGLDLEKWRRGDDLQKRRDLNLALEKAKRMLERATEDLVLSEQLLKEEFISKAERDDDALKHIEAGEALATARQNIEVYDAYGKIKEETKLESDVEQFKAELDRTIRKSESNLAKAKADLEAKVQALRIREDAYQKLQEQLAACTIRAPQDGTVVYASSVGPMWHRRDPIIQGRQVGFNDALFVLPDTRQMVAVLRVHEAMLRAVQVGQRVSVTIDARPGAPVQGIVDTIATTAEDGGFMNPDLREYKVRVDLPAGVDNTLKPAMRCSGQVFVERVDNVLAVPIQAVATEGRSNFVHVSLDSGKVRKQRVKVGRSSETYVEVLSGLPEGDQVLLRRPKAGEVAKSDEPEPADEKNAGAGAVAPPDAAPGLVPPRDLNGGDPPRAGGGEMRRPGGERRRPDGGGSGSRRSPGGNGAGNGERPRGPGMPPSGPTTRPSSGSTERRPPSSPGAGGPRP